MEWRLDGRNALVTGATRGIGSAIVDALTACGAQVGLVARTARDVDAEVARRQALGARVWGVAADVASAQGRARVVEAAPPRLDILVHNAGGNARKATERYTGADIDALLALNLTAALELSRSLLANLEQAAPACIVHVSSVSGLTSTQTGAPYAAAKAALNHLTRYLAVEWGPRRIRVNAVAPWYIETPLTRDVLADAIYRERVVARTPLGRIGTPADVAAAVTFLCLPAAGWITGQVLAIDGGFTAMGFAPPG